ncbi:hypothetical protein EU245_06030 [Lentibacillus lipolyticus]|nr:hypothetical protein EU245_06030 [Lentibacillus lipolyticus]
MVVVFPLSPAAQSSPYVANRSLAPLFYVIAVAVIGGAALAMLTFDVEKNDYRLSGKVVLKTLRRIVSIVIVVVLVRLFIT